MSFDKIPANATLKPEKFKISISPDEVTELRVLLKVAKLAPETFENLEKETGKHGVTRDWVMRTKNYWENEYDWQARENRMNSFPHFKVPIQHQGHTYGIHFVAIFSENPDAIPIVLLHGWPGSFVEFLPILSHYKSKYANLPRDLPYHIIVPSLPGYTFSSLPTDKDMKIKDVADIVDLLMVGLGFGDVESDPSAQTTKRKGYVAQGGDVGASVCRPLYQYPSCKAVHLNFAAALTPPEDESKIPTSDFHGKDISMTPLEQQGLERMQKFFTTMSAYTMEHAFAASTIGFVISSNPLALLCWIGEKFLTWTDPSSPIDTNDILDGISLYWFTGCFARSIWPYREMVGASAVASHSNPEWRIAMDAEKGKKGLGYSFFPMDVTPLPRAWVATTGDLVWSRLHEDGGGHFIALERPDVLRKDLEEFVASIYPSS